MISICLNFAAVFLAYINLIFGTLIFSSILFISTLDAVCVVARYLASALVCRGILLVEMARIRGAQTT